MPPPAQPQPAFWSDGFVRIDCCGERWNPAYASRVGGRRAGTLQDDSETSVVGVPRPHPGTTFRPQTQGNALVLLLLTIDFTTLGFAAVPEDHLRAHPLYRPLPPPAALTELKSIADLALFRQDSWQWLEMHRGRLTTSKATVTSPVSRPSVHATHTHPSMQCKPIHPCNAHPSIRAMQTGVPEPRHPSERARCTRNE